MSAPATSLKVCCVCGQDVSQQKRVKDGAGRYYCEPCYAPPIQGIDIDIAPEPPTRRKQPTMAPDTGELGVVLTNTEPSGAARRILLLAGTAIGGFFVLCGAIFVAARVLPRSEDNAKHEYWERKEGAQREAAARAAAELPNIRINDSDKTLTFSDWKYDGGWALEGVMRWNGAAKIDSIAWTAKRGGVVKHRGTLSVPGGVMKKDEPVQVMLLLYEMPAGMDVEIDVNY